MMRQRRWLIPRVARKRQVRVRANRFVPKAQHWRDAGTTL